MSSFCKVTCGKNAGGTQRNASYILREKACERWETINLGEGKKLGITEKEIKKNVAEYMGEYAEQGRGARKDYRTVLSFKGEIDPEKAKELAREFYQKSYFKNCPAIIAVHTNTDNTHVHILSAARQVDGKKLDLSNTKYMSFDKTWARIYDRGFEKGAEKTHMTKCHETAAYKKAYVHGLINAPLPRKSPTIQQHYIWQRLEQLKSKVKEIFHNFKDSVKGIFQKEKDITLQVDRESKIYRKGQVYDNVRWKDTMEKLKAGIIPEKGKSPEVIRIPQADRQNLGNRFKNDGTYHNLDGLKGFAVNNENYGKDLYFIPNKGEFQDRAHQGRELFEKLKDTLTTAKDIRINQYQFEQLKKDGFFKVQDKTCTLGNGREFNFEKSGHNIDLLDKKIFDRQKEGLSQGMDKDLSLTR